MKIKNREKSKSLESRKIKNRQKAEIVKIKLIKNRENHENRQNRKIEI